MIISYIPEITYLRNSNSLQKNFSDKLDNDFIGFLAYKTWDNVPLYLLEISYGKVINRMEAINKPVVSKKDNSTKYIECNLTCYDTYIEQCDGNGQNCEWILVGSTDCNYYCGGPDTGYPGVTMNNGILEFSDMTAFTNLLAGLENVYENHNSYFFDHRDQMSDDAINDYAESSGFDEFKPLRDFENYFGFYSLRRKVESEINNWYAIGYTNLSNFPDNNYIIDDEIEQTVLNQEGKVIIGGQLVQYDPTFRPITDPEILSNPAACISTDRIIQEESYDNNSKVIRKKIMFDGYRLFQTSEVFLRTTAKGKVISFKRKGDNKLKKYATRMSISVSGNVYYKDACNLKESFNVARPTARRFRRKAKAKWLENRLAWKQNQIRADMVVNGQSKSIVY